MDALALLSDDEDGEEAAEEPKGSDEDPCAKRPKLGESIDFEALKKAGYAASEEADEQAAAAASLRNSFAAFEQAVEAEHSSHKASLNEASPEKKAASGVRFDEAEFGCEEPPDSVDVFDDAGIEPPAAWSTFEIAEDGLGKEIVGGLRAAGFKAPTPVQANTWPILASGRDLIGVAKTGSGKTLAFLLPFFARLMQEGMRPKTDTKSDLPVQMQKQAAGPGAYSPEILVLAPSRELAMQIETEAGKFTSVTGISTLACYGGEGLRKQQLGQLRERPECVVGTVGRLVDFIDSQSHWFGVKNVRFLILDEADQMLGEGLSDSIRKITVDVDTPNRQTAMFSATFDDDVKQLASWILRIPPVEVRVGMKDPLRANRDVDQQVMIVKDNDDKLGAVKTLLRKVYAAQATNPGKVLIFAGDWQDCDELAKKLQSALNGANIEVLHGQKKQADREKAMENFRSGESPMLVATNIAGRGLDVKDITLVVNYEPPEDGQDYVHRIGRTGRAGSKGKAVTLLRKGPDGKAMIYIAQVMRRTGLTVPEDLIYHLKQRRGRDMGDAAEALKGLVTQVNVQRTWARDF